MSLRRILTPAAAFLAAAFAVVAHAGFESAGWPGKGVKPTPVLGPGVAGPMSIAQNAWLDAVKAAFPALNEDDARTKANNIYMGLCKAIDLVKKRDATIGACLEDLKKKGNICISFNMKDAYGGARHDGKDTCGDDDKININGKAIAEGCPDVYDPTLYWFATVLLHEGKHCIQDYEPDTTGLDAEKTRATNTKRMLCNEASDGTGGESKGAHVEENDWIAEIKAALTELGDMPPMVDNAWSQATKDIFNAINMLAGQARADAIAALKKAACANKDGNDDAIDCYRAAKMALMTFINTNYMTPAEKQAALDALKDALKDAKWKWIHDFFDIPTKIITSNATTGSITQTEDGENFDNLETGLVGVSDMERFNAVGGDALLVAGASALNPGFGALQGYIDLNLDRVFSISEQVFHVELLPPVAALDSLDIVPPAEDGPPTFLLYDHAQRRFHTMFDINGDGVPEGVNPVPQFQISNPSFAFLVFEWTWDRNGQFLRGTEGEPVAAGSARNWNHDEPTLLDFNFDGIPDQVTPPQFIYDHSSYGPTFSIDPIPADFFVTMSGRIGSQIAVESLDANFIPIEILALDLVGTVDPHPVPLSRPLQPGETIQLHDLTLGVASFTVTLATIFGDLNGDCLVNTADLGLLISSFGDMGKGLPADLNGDNVVDTADLGLLLAAFGNSCPPET